MIETEKWKYLEMYIRTSNSGEGHIHAIKKKSNPGIRICGTKEKGNSKETV